MCDRKYGLRPALELQEGTDGVLDFTPEEDVPADGSDLHQHPEQTQQQFDAVTSEVEHRAAASVLFVQQPAPRVVGSGVETLEGVDLRDDRHTYLARLQNLSD